MANTAVALIRNEKTCLVCGQFDLLNENFCLFCGARLTDAAHAGTDLTREFEPYTHRNLQRNLAPDAARQAYKSAVVSAKARLSRIKRLGSRVWIALLVVAVLSVIMLVLLVVLLQSGSQTTFTMPRADQLGF